jgi:hypothetical protein
MKPSLFKLQFSSLVEQLISAIIDLFLAGSETSSNAIGLKTKQTHFL